jgi:hypothetical protein
MDDDDGRRRLRESRLSALNGRKSKRMPWNED